MADAAALIESLKAIGRYLKTPAGIGSALPGIVLLADITLRFIPIPSLVKPVIYVVALFGVLFAFYYETARYSTTLLTDADFNKMERRSITHFVISAVLALIYVLSLTVLDAMMPRELIFDLLLWVISGVGSLALMEFTRTIIILGLKSYIAQNSRRPMPN